MSKNLEAIVKNCHTHSSLVFGEGLRKTSPVLAAHTLVGWPYVHKKQTLPAFGAM